MFCEEIEEEKNYITAQMNYKNRRGNVNETEPPTSHYLRIKYNIFTSQKRKKNNRIAFDC